MTGRSVETDDEADDGADDERPDAHLRDLDPGAGCTEIWEHLSEERDEE
ncbi:hypothetical protein [Haloarchaeobius iranensis]|uniref:Uncharacterized protein n=1 Tax=Haloarchaeobius iranensis TaxID=996166 RepID=A0A1H0AUK3_9EURY|nr:hypothetical protein [Haloarchaeobius iranensis]SDN37069.1 hypothetical protein SAMN05192554_13011 [Haloarchaeobius iranensis]